MTIDYRIRGRSPVVRRNRAEGLIGCSLGMTGGSTVVEDMSTSGGWVTLEMNTVFWDPFAFADFANNRAVIPPGLGGLYWITASVVSDEPTIPSVYAAWAITVLSGAIIGAHDRIFSVPNSPIHDLWAPTLNAIGPAVALADGDPIIVRALHNTGSDRGMAVFHLNMLKVG